MSYKSLMLAAAALAAVAVAPALAEEKSGPKHGAKVCRQLAAIDPDNDGALDLAEAKKQAAKVFAHLNRDKDDTLDRRELFFRLSRADFAAANPDNDGTIDRNEYVRIVVARFKAADPDKDGTIECKELKTREGRALLRLLRK